MKILVIGGMHGNEPLGLAVVSLFQAQPVACVTTLLANEQAIALNTRFITTDLNRSFPGDVVAPDYEMRRAGEVLRLTRGYDLVLDFHNTQCPDNDCGFVGAAAGQLPYDAAGVLGLEKVIVADYECINKYATNCLSVEISLHSSANAAAVWYERIVMLSRLDQVIAQPKMTKYRFVYRMTLDDRDRLDLSSYNLRAFRPLPRRLARTMGVSAPAFPIFINDGYTPYNYGGLLNKID